MCLPAHVHAQRIVPALDFGAVTVGYADSLSQRAASIAPSLQVDAPWASAYMTGLYAKNTDRSWTAQGNFNAAVFFPVMPRASWLQGEIAPSLGGSTHSDGTHTDQMLVTGRLRIDQSGWGGWLGGGAGRAWDGLAWHNLTVGNAGIWGSAGATQMVVTATPTSVQETGSGPIRYTDVQGTVRWTHPWFGLSGSLGTRAGENVPTVPKDVSTWGSASATFWFLRTAAVVLSGGNYPIDFTQGFPGGRYASVALHVEPYRHTGAHQMSDNEERADAPRLLMRDTTDSMGRRERMFWVLDPHLTRVELAGDFTNWQPVTMTRAGDGRWLVALPVTSGVHQMALRLNGGGWTVPPGLTPLSDEFGGSVGLVVVP